MKQFERLFAPRSIAVVGVSEDAVRPGSQAVHALLRYGYAGAIYPVNPKYPAFEGLKCYPSISAIEGEIDLAVIGIPARGVVGVIKECAQKRVPFAVVPSGGFRESGPDGAALQDRMLAIARDAGMRIVGPNCLGLANIHNNVYAAFGSITRPPQLQRGSVSLVTQSGGFGYSIALACAQEGIGFRNVIATGNEADIDAVEFIEALLDDAETQIIVLQNAAARAPQARVEGVIISEMVTEGFELLAGAINDPSCGPVVVVGAGGIYAETLADKTCRLAPFDEQTALEMIGELKCSAILRGARGRAPLDVGAVAKVLTALSQLAWHNRETIAEIDINPLFALPTGAIAADALVVRRDK